jgi:hypothetical protein
MIAIALLILVIATFWALCTTEKPSRARNAPDELESRPPRKVISGLGCAALVLFALVFLFGIALGPIAPGTGRHPQQGEAMQTTRSVALAMFQYANDNDGKYPDGASSTEVFQKLMDGQYISDPAIFFVALPGKVRAETGAKLKPENVAYDVTSGVDAHSPDGLPVVFLTGFRMNYATGASVVSLVRPFPSIAGSWSFLSSSRDSSTTFDGLPVAYKSNNAFFRVSYLAGHPTQYTPDGYGIVPNVVPPDFDAHAQIYRQLTPDGILK